MLELGLIKHYDDGQTKCFPVALKTLWYWPQWERNRGEFYTLLKLAASTLHPSFVSVLSPRKVKSYLVEHFDVVQQHVEISQSSSHVSSWIYYTGVHGMGVTAMCKMQRQKEKLPQFPLFLESSAQQALRLLRLLFH